MLLETAPGRYQAGEADVILIAQLGARFHVVFLEEHPLPGPIGPIATQAFIRLKSKMHHTAGEDTLAGAQARLDEMRETITIADANVSRERALFVGDCVMVFSVANWVAAGVPFAHVLFPWEAAP